MSRMMRMITMTTTTIIMKVMMMTTMINVDYDNAILVLS